MPANGRQAIAARIESDIATQQGQFRWLIAGDADTEVAAHIAVFPPPPTYDLNGGLAGVILGLWRTAPQRASEALAGAEAQLRERNAAMRIAACSADDETLRTALEARGYKATTHYMAKQGLTQSASAPIVRTAVEADVPHLVTFNREARERLHEANFVFWKSHPDAETRFALWMKFSLSMRDRAMFVSEHDGRPSGFVIAQPASPIQVPITLDETQIGVIDDFHCSTFGGSLTDAADARPALALLQAAENDFVHCGKTAAIAICPAAWQAKMALLESAGYRTSHTWFTRPV